jgi:hypothetical protein
MSFIIFILVNDEQIRRANPKMRLGASRGLDRRWHVGVRNPQKGRDALEKHRKGADAAKSRGEVRKSKPRLIMTNSSSAIAKSSQISSEYKLHLAMDRDSYARLGWLKANLEASTDGEVIRRALKAFELFEPSDGASDPKGPNLGDFHPDKDIEHIYIRLPARMKDRLDNEREMTGRSYGEQVRQALRVLMQLVRQRDGMLAQIHNGDDVCANLRKSGHHVDDSKADDGSASWHADIHRKLVALC